MEQWLHQGSIIPYPEDPQRSSASPSASYHQYRDSDHFLPVTVVPVTEPDPDPGRVQPQAAAQPAQLPRAGPRLPHEGRLQHLPVVGLDDSPLPPPPGMYRVLFID